MPAMASSKKHHLSPLRINVDYSAVRAAPVSPAYSDISPTTVPSPRRLAFPPPSPSRRLTFAPTSPASPRREKPRPAVKQQQQQQQQQRKQEPETETDSEDYDDMPSLRQFPVRPHADIPPTVTITPSPSSSSSSVNTYDSSLSLDNYDEGDELFDSSPSSTAASSAASRLRLFPFFGNAAAADDDAAIPACLPAYRRASVSGTASSGGDPASCFLRASTPHAFGRLFPSLDRLAVRHDDLTLDGNMNLRVDTPLVPGGRRPVQYQLFHLRMHDLARREFSLRRYCRDSGREVCSSKRAYAAPSPAQRSVSSAIRSVKAPFRRESEHRRRASVAASTSYSCGSSAGTGSSGSSGAGAVGWWDPAGTADGSARPRSSRRPSVVSTTGSVSGPSGGNSASATATAPSHLVPTNTIKLEFSNYARVDVTRRGAKGHYDFEWWGHRYTWRRVVDKDLGGVAAFHLVRDGAGPPVAHVVPEARSPSQVAADEAAGGWVPPCYLWISDQSIVDAMTDVADVIVATGLIALVDDSIKERWPGSKPAARRFSHGTAAADADAGGKLLRPRAFINTIFQRRHSEQPPSSPLRAVAAH
jgi:hypothetical protein